jgi:hypothetical protein
VTAINQLVHLPVEERQQQRPDVRAVDVGVSHDDDAVITEFIDVEVLTADAAPERRDHRLDLVAAQHLVEARLFYIQNLAFDRQNRLEPAVATLLGRPAGRFAFHDVNLALRRIALLAIGKFAGKAAAVERSLATDQIACFTRRLARARSVYGLPDDAFGDRRILFEKLSELVVDDCLNDALDLCVSELGLGLALELWPRDLDADDTGEPFPDVITTNARVLEILREVVLGGVSVDRSGERRSEPGEMGTAFVGIDIVRESKHQL